MRNPIRQELLLQLLTGNLQESLSDNLPESLSENLSKSPPESPPGNMYMDMHGNFGAVVIIHLLHQFLQYCSSIARFGRKGS